MAVQYSDPSNEVTNFFSLAGFNPRTRTTFPEFRLGTHGFGKQGTHWVYVQASNTVATGTCTVSATTFMVTDTAGDYTADAAFANDEYGWVRLTAADIS